jgi:hypothetical protein
MTTIVVLGSKPQPALPPASVIEAVACANASGRSALRLGLPRPIFTVMSSVVPSAKTSSNRLALDALAGLSTGVLYIYPRPPFAGRPFKAMMNLRTVLRTTPPLLKRILRACRYHYDEIRFEPFEFYHKRICELCEGDAQVAKQVGQKAPSSGLIAAVLALSDRRYARVVLSGFSFEITHAYADNPDIARRGTSASVHAATDMAILAHLARRCDRLFTSEPVVHERTGVPLLIDGAAVAFGAAAWTG